MCKTIRNIIRTYHNYEILESEFLGFHLNNNIGTINYNILLQLMWTIFRLYAEFVEEIRKFKKYTLRINSLFQNQRILYIAYTCYVFIFYIFCHVRKNIKKCKLFNSLLSNLSVMITLYFATINQICYKLEQENQLNILFDGTNKLKRATHGYECIKNNS